ncbi:MAG: MFS transporter [Oscillospiraceae bacterium]|nr:MFS transporter [Oscillospiraceae bacterium]MCL2278771.1 MFS transporter [Oscillospiraceae bacterium]
MVALILALIYLAFIALGLPDSLLGAAWPTMHHQIGTAFENAGFITMIFASGTIISSLLSDRITRRLGAGLTTVIGLTVLAGAIFGISTASSFWTLIIWAVPYGLAAGTIDAALNNYVARHYSSRYMSWLHAFWGVGAVISPYIMGYALTRNMGWEHGYFTVSMIQVSVALLLLISLPLWRKKGGGVPPAEERGEALSLRQVLKIRGVKLVLPAFFAYTAVEATTMLWASSYLVYQRGIAEEIAARHAALFFWGIMSGRFLGGFIADKFGDRNMIRGSVVIMLMGITMIILPVQPDIVSLAGLVVLGLGCSTVFPSIIHSTPHNFGKENARAIIGVQMAGAYTGSTLMPPLLGQIARVTGIGFYPIFILVFTGLLLLITELLNRTVDRERKNYG